MTRTRRVIVGVATAPLLLCLPGAALAQSGWVTTQWLGEPRRDVGAAPPPLAITPQLGARALVAPLGFGSIRGWDERTRPQGGQWQEPAATGVPNGLVPVAIAPGGTLLAMGSLDTPAGREVHAAVRIDGKWIALGAVSAAVPGLNPVFTGEIAANGTLVMATHVADTVRITAWEDGGIQVITEPGRELPTVRVNETGDVIAAWRAPSGAGETLRYSVKAAGRAWRAPRRAPVPVRTSGGVLSFDLDITSTGTTLLAWAAGSVGRHRLWWSMMPRTTDNWLPSAPMVTSDMPGARIEGLRVTGGGDAVVMWSTKQGIGTLTRPAGARAWESDGPVPGAPGRGRQLRSPATLMSDRVTRVGIGWTLSDSAAITTRTATASTQWPAAHQIPTAPGPIRSSFVLGPNDAAGASWVVDSGVGTGRRGLAAREVGAPVTVSGILSSMNGRGDITLQVGSMNTGDAVITFTSQGRRTPNAAFSTALRAGTNAVRVPRIAAWRLTPGNVYTIEARGTQAPGASAQLTMPGVAGP